MRPGARGGGYRGAPQERCEACKSALKWRFTGGVFWELYCPKCEEKANSGAGDGAEPSRPEEKEKP